MTRRAFQPVKPCDPELPKAAVRRLIDQAGGRERAAIRIDRAPSTVYAYADPGAKDEMTFAQVAQLTAPATPACAEYLALLAGGVFFPIAARESRIGLLTADSIKQHGEACAELVMALSDNVIDAAERPKAIAEVDDAIAALVQLRCAIAARRSDGGS